MHYHIFYSLNHNENCPTTDFDSKTFRNEYIALINYLVRKQGGYHFNYRVRKHVGDVEIHK